MAQWVHVAYILLMKHLILNDLSEDGYNGARTRLFKLPLEST